MDREKIQQKKNTRNLLRRVCAGAVSTIKSPYKAAIFAVYLLTVSLIWNNRAELFDFSKYGVFAVMIEDLYMMVAAVFLFAGAGCLLAALGTPFGAKKAREQMLRAGVVNHIGEAPILLAKKRSKEIKNVTIWVFEAAAISLSRWEEKQEEIESALNIYIIKFVCGKGNKTISIHAVPAMGALPDVIDWSDNFLSNKDGVIRLGMGLTGLVETNLNIQPHLYIGGITGTGKSVLFKGILMQLIKQGAQVYLCDMKGGADFGQVWRKNCQMVADESGLLNVLEGIVHELEYRKKLVGAVGCTNIDRYSEQTGRHFPRVAFACDEVAEVFTKAAKTKERKERLQKIEDLMSLIAMQGRAYNINVIIATQRGDAQVLPPQLKSNLDTKIAGRCDMIVSQIILDSPDAAKRIPKDSKGRFIRNDGVLFQAFWVEDDMV